MDHRPDGPLLGATDCGGARYDVIHGRRNTALADDPELTCRLPGLSGCSPLRVVVDSRLRLPLTSKLVCGARTTPTLVFILEERLDPIGARAFTDCGVEVVSLVPDANGVLDVAATLKALAARGVLPACWSKGAPASAHR